MTVATKKVLVSVNVDSGKSFCDKVETTAVVVDETPVGYSDDYPLSYARTMGSGI